MNSSNNDVIVMWYCIRVALGDLLPSGFTGPTKLSNGDNYEVSEWDGEGCEWDGKECECECVRASGVCVCVCVCV